MTALVHALDCLCITLEEIHIYGEDIYLKEAAEIVQMADIEDMIRQKVENCRMGESNCGKRGCGR